MPARFLSDEATPHDRLNRGRYADAFARLTSSCDTPLVIGLYGTWGIGKSSLMRQIEARLDPGRVRTVWFDAWQHQFDDAPALAMMHTMVDAFGLTEHTRKLMTVIGAAFGSMLLKATTTVSIDDVDKWGERYERERYLIRESRVRLHQHFRELILTAQRAGDPISIAATDQNDQSIWQRLFRSFKRRPPRPTSGPLTLAPWAGDEPRRIVFFIDDLDRCAPNNVMAMLEALKLYLNIPNCVYFVAMDKASVEISLRQTFKDLEFSCDSYLDKIVQLPFTIPPIAQGSMREFIGPLLSDDLRHCKALLVRGLGDNPRDVKRFINALALNHELAIDAKINGYTPTVLATLLLIQHRSPPLYRAVTAAPELFAKLVHPESSDDHKYIEDHVPDTRLRTVLATAANLFPPRLDAIPQYLYLTQITALADEVDLSGIPPTVDGYVAVARSGRPDDVDILMLTLDQNKDFVHTKMIDNALGYVTSAEGEQRLRHYLLNGSQVQRNYAALYFKRRGQIAILREAVDRGVIDKIQAFSR